MRKQNRRPSFRSRRREVLNGRRQPAIRPGFISGAGPTAGQHVHPFVSVKNKPLEGRCIGRPEANVVVPVVRIVPIAVGDAAVVRVVVPRATAYDAVGTG